MCLTFGRGSQTLGSLLGESRGAVLKQETDGGKKKEFVTHAQIVMKD